MTMKVDQIKINGVDVHRDNTTSSHMPIQMDLFNHFKINSVLEFGCGYYSTKLYLKAAKEVHSLECDSMDWLSKIIESIGDQENWTVGFETKLSEQKKIIQSKKWDLIFIDGDNQRTEQTNFSFNYSDIIIVHDTQHIHPMKIMKPIAYFVVHFMNFPIHYDADGNKPFTSIYTNRMDVYNHLKNMNEKDLYKKHEFPYLYDQCPNPNYK